MAPAVTFQAMEPEAPQIAKRNPADSEKWLSSRLFGLSPADFPGGVAIYTSLPMDVPQEFRSVSRAISARHSQGILEDAESRRLCDVSAVLVFCDIQDFDQVAAAIDLANCVELVLGDHSPPTILIEHGSADLQASDEDEDFAALAEAMSEGFSGVIAGQSSGIRLACDIQSTITGVLRKAEAFYRALDKHKETVQRAQKANNCVKDIVWVYLKERLKMHGIPSRDFTIDQCRPGAWLDNFKVASRIGKGAHGAVHRLEDSEDSGFVQVVKVIEKEPLTSLNGLRKLSNEIRVMEKLSSAKWSHPNIIKLHEVYHSGTEVLLRMEDGGSRNLHSHLTTNEMKRFPLGAAKAQSMIEQCMEALCHMHLGPGIVHRDIKPENITTCETPQGICVKLCDFDLARIMRNGGVCSSVCGTFPFMAPEITGKQDYDPFAADIWSMAIVFLEILCSCNVVTKFVNGGRKPSNELERDCMTRDISKFFEQPNSLNNLLDAHLRPELRDCVGSLTLPLLEEKALEGMLHVQASQRWTAADLASVLEPGGCVQQAEQCHEAVHETVQRFLSSPCGIKSLSTSKALQLQQAVLLQQEEQFNETGKPRDAMSRKCNRKLKDAISFMSQSTTASIESSDVNNHVA